MSVPRTVQARRPSEELAKEGCEPAHPEKRKRCAFDLDAHPARGNVSGNARSARSARVGWVFWAHESSHPHSRMLWGKVVRCNDPLSSLLAEPRSRPRMKVPSVPSDERRLCKPFAGPLFSLP